MIRFHAYSDAVRPPPVHGQARYCVRVCGRIYRTVDEEQIPGTSRHIFVNNGGT
jgi:hypothetical protein